ncbi:MAG: hypothetical protein AAGI88_12975 [Pseudomonadota bacterium]
MNEKQRESLLGHFSEDEPFGPINASQVHGREANELLFDTHNKLYKGLSKRPSIVVGRKGAGKTAYLNSCYFDDFYRFVVKLDTAEQFMLVVDAVERATLPNYFAESVASVWDRIIHIALFCELRGKLPQHHRITNLISDYLAKHGLNPGSGFAAVLWHIADVLSDRSKGTVGIVAEIVRRVASTEYEELKKSFLQYLDERDQRVVVILDSLDDFRLDSAEVSRALQGLLKHIGRSNTPRSRIDVRFCLPAELYHSFTQISSNPTKDFQRELTLHWIAPELRILAVHRMLIYFELFFPKRLEQYKHLDSSTKRGARTIWDSIFPRSISRTKYDVHESALSYIFRHTQLLPRHVLILLNSIARSARRTDGNNGLQITEEAIIEGISLVENRIVQEVFSAYKTVHPNAQNVCRACIPELGNVFSLGDLERVFRRHGKAVFHSDDFNDFRALLVETGVIGKRIEETENYIQAQFEYTVPNHLHFSADDMYCVHPLYSGPFSSKVSVPKPIYPYGTNADDPDYRSLA